MLGLANRAVKSCQKTHPGNRSRQHRLTVYTQAYSHVDQGRSCHLARHNLKAQGITCVNEVIPYVHYIYIYICIYAVYIMIQCTEPATPAVIVRCELPVSLPEAVLGLKTPSPITVLSERASFGSCESSRSHTLEKSRSKEERPAQTIFRQMQTDASRCRQSALLT